MLGIILLQVSAVAQISNFSPLSQSVIIDLSALHQNYSSGSISSLSLSQQNKLLMPTRSMPQSQLHVPRPGQKNFAPSSGNLLNRLQPPKLSLPRNLVSSFTPPNSIKLIEPMKSVAPKIDAPKSALVEKQTPKKSKLSKVEKVILNPDVTAQPPKLVTLAPEPSNLQSPPPPPNNSQLKKTNISEPVKLAKNQANGSSDRQIKNKSNAKPTELPGNKLKTSKKPTDTDATDIKAIATLGTGDLSQPLQIVFSKQGAKLSETSRKELEKLAGTIINKKKTRVQLMAYARSENLSASRARRLSLSRALAVRSFLIAKGIRSTRIDVRALGRKSGTEPANRVDVNIMER